MALETLRTQATIWPHRQKLNDYYKGSHRLDAIGVSLPPQVRVLEMTVSWPKMAVEVLDEVLNIEGFRTPGDDNTAETLRTWWQANDLDTYSHLAHTEAMVQGSAYALIGPGTSTTPRITVHTSQGIAVERNHLGQITEAVQHYAHGEDTYLIHYTPGFNTHYKITSHGLSYQHTQPSGTRYIPLVPFINRTRISDTTGTSEMQEVLALADAASRSLTNLQVAQELLALPQRYLFGDGLTTLKDQNGNPINKLQAYLGMLWTGPKDAKAGQLPGADLSQIINAVKLYAQMVSSITGIPPSFLGIQTDNPSSAEAMRAAKERLITKAERKQALFGDAWEQVMRISLDMYRPAGSQEPVGLETLWRDPATPSKSAKAANALQAHAQGILSAHTAREALDLTPEQRAYEDALEGDVNENVKEMLHGINAEVLDGGAGEAHP